MRESAKLDASSRLRANCVVGCFVVGVWRALRSCRANSKLPPSREQRKIVAQQFCAARRVIVIAAAFSSSRLQVQFVCLAQFGGQIEFAFANAKRASQSEHKRAPAPNRCRQQCERRFNRRFILVCRVRRALRLEAPQLCFVVRASNSTMNKYAFSLLI